MRRREVEFDASGSAVRGWVFTPGRDEQSARPWPVVIMGEGLGGIKEMSLAQVGSAFAASGFAVIAFDYLNFGESDGGPRQLVDPEEQVRTYRAAVRYAERCPEIDDRCIALWGASFAGGHVLRLASTTDVQSLACAVAVVPFVGISGAMLMRQMLRPQVWRTMVKDTIPLVSASAREPALMQSADGYEFLVSTMAARVPQWRNEIRTESMSKISRYRPVSLGTPVNIPTRVIVATDDAVNPADRIRAVVTGASFLEIPGRHFDIYGSSLNAMLDASIDWFRRYLGVTQ